MASCQTETDATWRFLFPHLSRPHPCSCPQERNSFSHIDCTNSNILRASWEKADTAAVMVASQSWKGTQFIHGRSPCQCGVRFWFTTNWCAKETVQHGWSLTFSFIRAVFWGSTEFFNQKDKKKVVRDFAEPPSSTRLATIAILVRMKAQLQPAHLQEANFLTCHLSVIWLEVELNPPSWGYSGSYF